MKTFYKWFDYFLTLLLVSTIIAIVALIYLDANNTNTAWEQYISREGFIITIAILISFIIGLLYMILGIVFLVINRIKKNVKNNQLAKNLLLKGFIRSVLAFGIFFIFSLALSFFGLSLDQNCLCLPHILDPNKPGFPVEDLTITNRKLVPPQVSNDSWYCDVTIHNNNTKMTAINLSFKQYEESTDDDAIQPGKSSVITIYSDNVSNNNPCKNVSITAAEIMVPDNN